MECGLQETNSSVQVFAEVKPRRSVVVEFVQKVDSQFNCQIVTKISRLFYHYHSIEVCLTCYSPTIGIISRKLSKQVKVIVRYNLILWLFLKWKLQE